jgi:hypothetical protein
MFNSSTKEGDYSFILSLKVSDGILLILINRLFYLFNFGYILKNIKDKFIYNKQDMEAIV